MKIYIFVDMEGISGVWGSEFARPDGRLYQTARRYYTWDINACARGCFQAGAEGVIVRDGHSFGGHAIWDELDPRVEIVQGIGHHLRMPGLEECSGLILLGYHAMAGTREAVMQHTFSSASFQNMWLNGRLAGEIAFDAALAGDYGVPTIMVSGDDATCREALEWMPQVVTCQVKQGLACESARLLPLEVAHRKIEECAANAVQRLGSIPPLQVAHPVTIRREMKERNPVPHAIARPDLHIIDGRTYEVTADTMEEAFARL